MSSGRFDDIAMALTQMPARAQGTFRSLVGTGGEKWAGGMSGSGRGRAIHHSTARANARVAMQESVQARAVVERSADTIADGGLRLQLEPIAEILGITRERAAEWARDTALRFHLWAKDKNQHRPGQMNFYQSQQFWQLCRHRDNDQFVRLFYERNPNLQNPLQFEFLDPDQFRSDALTIAPTGYGYGTYTSTAGFQGGDDGIVRDEWGRELEYRVWVLEADGRSYKEVQLPKYYKGGRIAMLHGFTPEYAGQGRGYSRLAHAVQEFENITDFSAATIKKAINQSNIFAFVKPAKDEDTPNNPLESILNRGSAGPASQLFGSNPQAVDGIPVTPVSTVEDFRALPEATVNTPGSIFVASLTKGAEISFPANTAPGDSFDNFVDAFAGHLAASLRIPLEVVLMKFGQNYSASRATLLLFWRVACIERDEMATDYLNPVVEMWLSEEIAAGRIIAPGWSDPRMRAAWLNCNWIGSGPPDIDPAKSAKARRENLEIGVTNVDLEAINFNGTSAADNIARNNATFKGYKRMPWDDQPAPAAAPVKGDAATTNQLLLRVLDVLDDMEDRR